MGFPAGIAVHPAARGRGLGRAVCALPAAEAVTRHGTAALMVGDDNSAAIRAYRAVGLRYRPLAAASVAGPCG